MKAISCMIVSILMLGFGPLATADQIWTEGVNYFLVDPPHVPDVPAGKVEVTEAFSYACPACNIFQPTMQKLKAAMPGNVVVDYLPAAFNPSEDWPMFQLAYLTAQALGIDRQTHEKMFDAVWTAGGSLAVTEGRNLRSPLPSIEDAAQWYNKQTGVPVDKFLATSKSFQVVTKKNVAEQLMQQYRVDRTPTIIVNGKYRLFVESAGGDNQVIDLVKYLVAKESAAPKAAK
ncbi:MAG TPA: thiol:disulfide interchange protein DsbA/DsbL [Steroidobacteraceae bacterium]